MKQRLAFLCMIVPMGAFAQNCTITSVGGSESQYAYGFVCDRSADGGTVVAVRPDNELGGMPLSRVAPDGTIAWSRRISCTNMVFRLLPTDVAALDDGGAVIIGQLVEGTWMPYSFFIRVDGSGQPVIAKILGRDWGPDVQAAQWKRICRTQDGAFVLTGNSESTTYTGAIPLMKIDADGNEVWGRRFTADANGVTYQRTETYGLIEDPNGDLVLLGNSFAVPGSFQWFIRTSAAGDLLWTRRYEALGDIRSACATSDGGSLLSG